MESINLTIDKIRELDRKIEGLERRIKKTKCKDCIYKMRKKIRVYELRKEELQWQ